MKADPALAAGAPRSWKRSSQPDSAEAEGVARPRSRRKRLASSRRSWRESKFLSTARKPAAKPPPRTRRRPNSERPPPASSEYPTSLAALPPARSDGSPPPARSPRSSRNKPAARPTTSAHAATNHIRTGNRAVPVTTSHTPLVMVFESQSKSISLMNQDQRGTETILKPNPGRRRLNFGF